MSNTINKWVDESNRQFSKEVQVVNKYMKNYWTSFAIKEMQIKMVCNEIPYHPSQNGNHQEKKQQ
jgi:hypothetical protein